MANKAQFCQTHTNPQLPGVYDINPSEIFEKMSDLCVVDVRQPEEYTGELGHIAGAQLIPLAELPDKISGLPKDKTIVFVCRSGGRSAHATAFAKHEGFIHVYNMYGGMLEWNNLELPVSR